MKKLLPLLAALLVVGLLSAPAAYSYEPADGGTFNVPRPFGSKAKQYRLIKHVERAINRAPGPTKKYPKPTILISTYLLDRPQSVDALVAACRRGISVRVLLDEDIENRNSKRLIRVLNADNVRDEDGDGEADRRARRGPCNRKLPGSSRAVPFTDAQVLRSVDHPTEDSVTWGKDRSYVKRCSGSCRGGGGNMHSKFYAFTRTGTAKNVVMVSSSNLNRGGAMLGWNDLYTMKNRPVTYQGYQRIHREMTDDTRAGDGKVEIKDGPFISRFFPMRNARKANDPTMQDLRKVRCRSAFGRTRIHVSMFYWKGTRGNYLANRLLELAGQGCRVSVIVGAPSIQIATRLREAARRRQIYLYDSRWDFNDDGWNEVRTHAKYVLVKGRFGKDRSSWQVWTGSQNWVAGSLSRSDEVTLNIGLRSAYRDYLRNWNDIRQHSRRLPYRF